MNQSRIYSKHFIVILFIIITLFISHSVAESSDESERQLIKTFLDAVEKGNVSKVKDLISRGANVNVKDKDGWTALIIASFEGHIEIAKELIANGTDVNAKANNGVTALVFAYVKGHDEIFKELIDRGADVNEIDQIMQKRLFDLGYFSGEPDGKTGKNTKDAIRSYQRFAGLPRLGYVYRYPCRSS